MNARTAPASTTASTTVTRAHAPLAHLPVQSGPAQGPLTSEPPLTGSAFAPLTSEPPLADEAPLTSEPTLPAATAAGF
ncbi:hypothetical protein [Streptomyces sp. NPDC048606]|uniref:hypothetical protein n=1 Tax=Streptomyces sp. NPDC048606 TaxID=3154726 RepID=UPI00343B263C